MGTYTANGFAYHGFLLGGGTSSTIDVPGPVFTQALGINDAGQIVGSYYGGPAGLPSHGFLLGGGTYTTIDVPGSRQTVAYGINDAGQIVGAYEGHAARAAGSTTASC